MKKLVLVLISVMTIGLAAAQSGPTEVGSVMLPNSMKAGSSDLVLNGAGIRKKAFVIKLYSGGLYLNQKSSDDNTIVNADAAMAMKLVITSSFVSSEAMSDAVRDGFDASMDGNTSPLATQIDTFITFFSDEIVENDVFDITYQPGKGVVAYKNGKELGVVQGMDFKKALFGIWLGENPVDKKLKKAMLGK
jgi:hypothetical protein